MNTPTPPPPTPDDAGRFPRSGLFVGMMAPTLLTSVGAVLLLRAGVVVGHAGAAGALIVWGVAVALTAITTASMSAILSNARPDAPSVLGAVRGSLGRQVATLVGLPMLLARAFAAATAGLAIAATFDAFEPAGVLVGLCVVVAAGVGAWQAGPLVRAAIPVVLGVVGIGVVAMVTGPTASPTGPWIARADYGALLVYVIPVVAGVWVAPDVIVGTGEVRRPTPIVWALGIGWLLQLVVVAWFSQLAPASVLITEPGVGLGSAAVPLVARAGLVTGAAFAAIVSLQDGAQLARGLLSDRVPALARPGFGEIGVTGVALAAVVALRDLDAAATALTLALLFAFVVINTVVGIELALGLSSFRPSIRVSPIVPVLGAVGAATALLLTHALGGLVLTAGILVAAALLVGQGRAPDDYSALLAAVGERLARRTSARMAVRAWKPSMVVPVRSADQVGPALDLLADIAGPEGTIRFLGTHAAAENDVDRLVAAVRSRGIDAGGASITATDDPTPVALEALQIALFRPNLLVLRLSDAPGADERVLARVAAARRTGVGVLLVGTPPGTPVVAARRTITLWVRSSPGLWDPLVGYGGRNLDLTLLLGWRLAKRWGSQLRLVTVVNEPEERIGAERFLAALCSQARLPPDTARIGIVGKFEQAVDDLSNSDLDVFGLQPAPDLARIRELVRRARSTCLFVLDSGRESALV